MRRRERADTPPAPTTSTDLSTTGPRARVHDTHPLKRYQERQLHDERQRVALLNVFEQMAARLGGILAIDQAAAEGDVLGTFSRLIPAGGVLQMAWKQAAAAVVVGNHTGQDVTATLAVAGNGIAPVQGTGVFRVPAGSVRVLNMRGNVLTVFGEAGGLVDVVALLRPREPFAGVVAPGALEGVAIPAGATTAQTVTLAGMRRQLLLIVNATAASAGNTVAVAVNGISASGYVFPLLSSAAIAAVGTSTLGVGPGLPVTANVSANAALPRRVQIVTTIVGAPVYGVDYENAP